MYQDFSEFYDKLTGDVDYKSRAEYYFNLFLEFDRAPTLLLDLACGTGSFSNAFSEKGVSVIGVDVSPDMLVKAKENSANLGQDVLYLCQDAAELDLYGTVDGAICCLDSLNHITDYDKLCAAIARVSLFLEPERLFIFDVNTIYKHETVLGNNTFVIDEDDVYCVWSNDYDAAARTTYMALDFFVPDENGKYERFGEDITERAYTHEELKSALDAAGLQILAVYGENTSEKPQAECQRAVYVTRKV